MCRVTIKETKNWVTENKKDYKDEKENGFFLAPLLAIHSRSDIMLCM